MTNRYFGLILIFGGSVVIFVILLLINPELNNTVIPPIFFLSCIGFIFSREEKVENTESLEIPALDYYQESRINRYGYAVAGVLVACSITFYLLVFPLGLPAGFISLLLFGGFIGGVWYVERYIGRLEFNEMVTNYIVRIMLAREKRSKIEYIIARIQELPSVESEEALVSKVVSLVGTEDLNKEEISTIVGLYLDYVFGTEYDLSPGEMAVIDELNG